MFPGGDRSAGAFVNFGPGYAGARDRYVYLLAAGRPAGRLYMARVPRGRLQVGAAYEYLAGRLDAPGWAPGPAAASPVFADRSGVDAPAFVFDAGIDRFLLTAAHGKEGGDGGRLGRSRARSRGGRGRRSTIGTAGSASGRRGHVPRGRIPERLDGGRRADACGPCSAAGAAGRPWGEACGAYDDGYNLMRARLTLAPGRR